MTKKVIFEMGVFEMIEWIDNHPLFMGYLYALERAGIFNIKSH